MNKLTADNSSMRERMQIQNWSPVRKAIFNMKVGDVLEYEKEKSPYSQVRALNNALWGECSWDLSLNKGKGVYVLTRTK